MELYLTDITLHINHISYYSYKKWFYKFHMQITLEINKTIE